MQAQTFVLEQQKAIMLFALACSQPLEHFVLAASHLKKEEQQKLHL